MTEKREILFQLSLLGGRKMEKDEHVTYQHFILESLSDVFKIIQPNGWMASVDLKDAFNTMPIHNAYQKYFKLMLYQKYQNVTTTICKHFKSKVLFLSHLLMTLFAKKN